MYQNKNRSKQDRKGDSTPTSFSDSGLSGERLNLITNRIKKDVEDGLYHGAAIIVARHGIIGMHEAIGFSERSINRPCRMLLQLLTIQNLLRQKKIFIKQ